MRRILPPCCLFLLVIALAGCGSKSRTPTPDQLSATVALHRIYGDGMVLQRNREIRIAGLAEPGKAVALRLGDEETFARADATGRFVATFSPREAGGPLTLTVRGREQERVLTDILVGEVWLGSGQSNMEWRVKNSMNFAREKAEAENPMIRHYAVPHVASPGVIADDIRDNKGWQKASPETVGDFSAVLYFFAKNLQRELNVPVGIINSSWGGTMIEPWISAAAYEAAGEKDMAAIAGEAPSPEKLQKLQADFRVRFAAWEKELANDYREEAAAASGWMSPKLDTSSWKTCNLPAELGSLDVPGNGVVWFRRTVSIPADWAGRDLILSLGRIDDCDETYFNGRLAGRTGIEVENYWNVPRRYRIPGREVAAGENVIAVRVSDHAYSGGFLGKPGDLFLAPADAEDQRIALGQDWRFKIEFVIDWKRTRPRPSPPVLLGSPQQYPSALYNGMIAGLQSYPVQGILWYQGESNAGNARLYARYFPLLIESWRREWRDPEQTFIFAQLAAFQRHTPGKPLPDDFFATLKPAQDNAWSQLRESQTAALRLPRTGMAVCIDIGDPIDIHPVNKQDVGRRMALEALRIAYGRDIVSAGPLYERMTVEGAAIRIRFQNTGFGLAARGGELRQFAIAGEDGVFHNAQARIDGDTVLVSAPGVNKPKTVRYAWASYPEGCNLYNREGLPASPFRTDTPGD